MWDNIHELIIQGINWCKYYIFGHKSILNLANYFTY